MSLAFLIPAFLSSCFVPTAECESVSNRLNLTNFGNGSFSYQDIIFSPFTSALPISKLYFLQSQYPDLLFSPKSYDLALEYKNGSRKDSRGDSSFRKRHAPARVPRVRSSKDYGKSAHYRMKGSKDSSKKNFYMSLLQNLLRPGSSSRKGKDYFSSSSKYSSPTQYTQVSSSPTMEAAPGGWGWGWSGGKGHGHGHGVSVLDLLLCGLSLLSLGGFLLNLLLNLLNMFGMGMFTTTATYPVTVTQTQTATATGTGGATGGTSVTYPTALNTASALGTGGWGFTGRNFDSMAGNGWGWGGGSQAYMKGHVKFGGGWPSTTTTPPPTTLPTLPTSTGTGTGGTAAATVGALGSLVSLFTKGQGRKRRRKREMFQPYVNPSTAVNTLAKAILNSINAATNKYECIEKIFCENNKQARVIGQWLDYFMPAYSFSLSYFGHRVGAHDNLYDHIRAIVLGVAETNCQAHFPRCGEPTHP